MPNTPKPGSTVPPQKRIDYTFDNDPLNYAIKAVIALLQTSWEAPESLFPWRANLEETGLVITEEVPLNLDTLKDRPAIAVSLAQMAFNGLTLDDLAHVKITDGAEMHTDTIAGTLVYHCMSRVQHEARFIGWQSARITWLLRKLLIREAHFQEIGRKIRMGPVSPPGALMDGDTEGAWYDFPVEVPFHLQWNDWITPQTRDWDGRPVATLQNIEATFRTKFSPLGTSSGTIPQNKAWGEMTDSLKSNRELRTTGLRGPTMRGRPINVTKNEPAPPHDGLKQNVKIS